MEHNNVCFYDIKFKKKNQILYQTILVKCLGIH